MEGKKTVNVIESLLKLQDIDGQIRDLERDAKVIPQRKAKENARLAGVNAELEIAKSQLAAMQQRIKNEMEEGDQYRAKLQALKIAQPSITSNKELQQSLLQQESLQHDADAADTRALALEEDELPHLKKRLEDAQSKVDAERGGVDGYVAELDARLAEVKQALDEFVQSRKEAAAGVPPRFLLYYERLRTKRWPVVTTLNNDGVCDGCHMKQPPFVAQTVAHNAKDPSRAGELATCTMCGRILYSDF